MVATICFSSSCDPPTSISQSSLQSRTPSSRRLAAWRSLAALSARPFTS
jgi:hypothetical protein